MASVEEKSVAYAGYGAGDRTRPLMAGQVAESYSFPEFDADEEGAAASPLWRNRKVQLVAGLAALFAISR